MAASSEEKAHKMAEKMNRNIARAGETQAVLAIGETVLALIEQGSALSIEAIIAHLQAQAVAKPVLVLQARNAAAEKELLGAHTKSRSQ